MSSFSTEKDFLSSVLRYDTILIAGHESPDADCIGSQLALQELFQYFDKTVYLLNAGPFSSPELRRYAHLFLDKAPSADEGSLVLCVDCPDLRRTGALSTPLREFPCAVLDHHPPEDPQGIFPKSRLVDATVPAAAVLVFRLIKAAQMPLSQRCAHLLFFGLASDSGFFRFLTAQHAEAFSMAAELTNRGSSPAELYAELTAGRTFDEMRMLARVVDRAEPFHGGRVLLCWMDAEEHSRVLLQSPLLFEMLMSIEAVSVVVFLRELSTTLTKLSFRSKGFDVSKLAQRFGGGGHRQAAGASLQKGLAAARDALSVEIGHIQVKK